MKREPALRWLPVSCALALVLSAILTPTMVLPAAPAAALDLEDGSVALGGSARIPFANAYAIALMIALQSVVVAVARFIPIRIRVRDHERALPITTRDAVLARMATTGISLLAPMCIAAAVFAAFRVEDLWRVPLQGALAISAAVSLAFVYRPRRAVLGGLETVLVAVVAVAVLIGSVLAPPDLFAALAAAVTCAALATVVARTGGVATVDDPRPEPAAGGARPLDLGVRLFGPLRWTLVRSTVLRPQVIAFLVLAAVAPAAFAGGNRAILIWVATLTAAGTLRIALQSLHGLGGLPFPRERLLRYAVLPTLAVLAASVVASEARSRPFVGMEPFSRGVALDLASERTLTGLGTYHEHVRVPPSLWRIGSPEDAVVTAPWGETATVHTHPLWPGASVVAYNPYDVEMAGSREFLEWQLARALAAVHGPDADHADAAETWVRSMEPEGGLDALRRAMPAAVSLRLRESDSTELGYAIDPWRDAPRRIGFAALEATLLWLVLCAFVLRPNVPDDRGRFWRTILQSDALGVTLIVGFACSVIIYESADRVLVDVVEASLGQWIDARIGGTPWAWAGLVAAVAAGGYALLRWRIGRIEVPPLALNGWTKKPVAIF